MDNIIMLTQKGMWLALLLSLPVAVTALVVGLLIAVFQAATQIQDQGLPTTAKLVVCSCVLLATHQWMAVEIRTFAETAFSMIRKF